MISRPLDPELLRAFVAVAEQRSFTRAAAALHRTQSAVSMQIRRLEREIGQALFRRSRTAVALSAAGESLLGYAHRILALHAEAIDHLRQRAMEGVVRLGVMDDYGTVIVPPLLARFAAAHPRIHVEMETGLTSGMVGRLGAAFDLVIAMHPLGATEGTFLRREQAVWAAGADHGAELLSPLPVALYPMGCLFRRWAMAALDAAGIAWRLAFVSHSLGAVEAVAAEGLAVTVVKAGTFPARLRRAERLPPLPAAEIRLHRAPGLSDAGALLATHLAGSIAERPAPRDD
jgi:DNA-binding transcriptional LysR family regulator